ncbi:MAG: hypothetical protein ACM3MD_12395 [Betaproteobacteria bacterium]
MESGIIILTQQGRDALKNAPPNLSPLCRNILIQIDGKKSVADVQLMFRGLKGLEESLRRLFDGNFIQISRECKDLIKSLAQQMLGSKAPTLIKKIDEMHVNYGDACWDHLEELYKTARLFYGAVVADNLKTEITKILRETGKLG